MTDPDSSYSDSLASADSATADLYRRSLLWSCLLLLPGGILYDAYLEPGPLIPMVRYIVGLFGLGLAAAASSGWLNARDVIRTAQAISFAFMLLMALAFWDADLDPLVLSVSFLCALAIGSTLHTERLVISFHLWSGCLLMIAVVSAQSPPAFKPLLAIFIICYVLLMGALATLSVRTKLQLQHSEKIMNAVFENASDALVYADTRSGDILRTNLQARTLFESNDGPTIGHLMRTAYLDAQPEDLRGTALRDALRDPMRESTVQFLTAKQNSFWGRGTFRRISVTNKDITLVRITDVTTNLLENRATQQTKRLLDRSQALAQLGGWEFDIETEIWSYTDVAREILELPEVPTVDSILKLFRDPDQQRTTVKAFFRALEGETGFDVIADVETHNGKQLSLHILAEPVVENGSVAKLFGVFADISPQREREQALQEARDAAESAANARSQFLANMSHEIRTPMNGVIGMTSLLADTELNRQQKAYAETIRSSGESLLHILNEILDFSKIEADQLVLEERVFELEKCLFDAIHLVAPAAADKGLEIVCEMDTDSRQYFYGDSLRLRQVLINLLSNAIKFTERGEILVRVTHIKQADGTSELNFDVADTGVGVPADRAAALFDPFTQADSSTTRKHGGTGLGLSICKSLVELMGGQISLTSTLAASSPDMLTGSTFSFYIVSRRAVLPRLLPRASAPNFDGRDLRVAVIDDNRSNQSVLGRMLKSLDIKVDLFDGPEHALQHFKNYESDLIIADMQMPGMDGLQLLLKLKDAHRSTTKSLRKSFPKTLLLSSLDTPARAHDLFDLVLTKPVRPSELQNALASLLGSSTDTESTREAPEQALTPLNTKGISVLLAEDNIVNQTVAISMLDKLGFAVDLASNGQEAVEMTIERPYDIVLMDVQMPILDGLEATRAIRETKSHVQPYIVAMTANAMHEDRVACVNAGMDDFVAKPIRLRDVHACMAIALEARSNSARQIATDSAQNTGRLKPV